MASAEHLPNIPHNNIMFDQTKIIHNYSGILQNNSLHEKKKIFV